MQKKPIRSVARINKHKQVKRLLCFFFITVLLILGYLNFGGLPSPAGTSPVGKLATKSLNNEYPILLLWQQKGANGMN
jgi:hypothetical protein